MKEVNIADVFNGWIAILNAHYTIASYLSVIIIRLTTNKPQSNYSIAVHLATSHPFKLSDSPIDQRS